MSLITVDQLDTAVPMARIAAFIAQVAHESGNFRYTEENMNYSWSGLRKTWPGKFPTGELAQRYHRQPERIATEAARCAGSSDRLRFPS